MKKISVVLIALISFIFMGCTAAQQQFALQSTMIGMETQLLKKQYVQVETLIRGQQDTDKVFTEEEWLKLLNVDSTIDMLMARYEDIQNMDVVSVNIQDIMFMWQLTTNGYGQAREVVEAHFDEFSPTTQMLLNSFDRQAIITNARISNLLNNPSNESINQSVVLIATYLGLAVEVVGLSATLL